MTSDLQMKVFPTGRFQCNCTVLWDSETLHAMVIDPGDDADPIRSLIIEQQLDVQYLLHTHAHFDHIACSECLKLEVKAPLCLHKDDLTLYENLDEQGKMFGLPVDPPGTVDHYIEDEETFSLVAEKNTFSLRTLHTPGHTQGSCSFYMEWNDKPLLWSGDTLFQGSVGRTDLPGGNTEQMFTSIKDRLLKLPEETMIIPGHGPGTTLYDEKRSNPFL